MSKIDALKFHIKIRGKLKVEPTTHVTQENLAYLYTPGVAKASLAIAKKSELVYKLTRKWNSVAVVSDGTRVLGLGDVGPKAALPVMEGKALIYKHFADIDAWPLCVEKVNAKQFISLIQRVAPTYGAINLEDVESPKSLIVEKYLREHLDIPILHDDQYGTGVVAYAALINALHLVNKKIGSVRIVIAGAGAAGIGVANMLLAGGAKHIMLADSRGALYPGRNHLNSFKAELAKKSNPKKEKGDLEALLVGADVFIGVSGLKGLITRTMIKTMAAKAIVFALSNPDPEILPDDALAAGAFIVATGRSDFDNQVNNSLVFPGLMRAVLDSRAKRISEKMLLTAGRALAGIIKPTARRILPLMSDKRVVPTISKTVVQAAKKSS